MEFYPSWPLRGIHLGRQMDESRNNADTMNVLNNAAQADIATVSHEHALARWMLGELDFKNKWAIFYDKSADQFSIQFNEGTSAVPVWSDVIRVLDSNNRTEILGSGGLQVTGGFYFTTTLTIKESEFEGAEYDAKRGILVFDSDTFYTSIGGDGNPLVSNKPNKITVAETQVGGYSQLATGIKFLEADGFYVTSGPDGLPVVGNINTTNAGTAGTVTSVTFAESEAGGLSVSETATPVLNFTSPASVDEPGFYLTLNGSSEPVLGFSKERFMTAQMSKIGAAQSITDAGSAKVVTFDNTVEDIGGWADLAGDEFDVPAGVRRVVCTVSVNWDNPDVDGIRVAEVRKNGASMNPPALSVVSPGPAIGDTIVQCFTTFPIDVVTGDALEVAVFQNSGTTTDVLHEEVSQNRTYFSIYKVD